jgi:outer membrane protein OmpA-like peptidoglycan-associated protein
MLVVLLAAGSAWAQEAPAPSSMASGGVGLLHVAGADLGRPGVLRFAGLGEYFSSADFPVLGAENTRTAGTFALAYVPLDFLEVSLAYTASANTNSRSTPNLIQALGDVTLGARASRQWHKGLWAGVDVRLQSFSGVGGVERNAFGVSPRLIGTYDARELLPQLPLRAHANLGLLLDGTGELTDSNRLNAAEEYALGVHRYHRLALGLAVEAPLPMLPVATPFLEYGLAMPLGVEGGQVVAPDGQLLPVGSVAPQTLGVGAKVRALRNLTFTVAAEFGLTRLVGKGVPATPPFNLFLGASFNADLVGPPAVQERPVEALAEARTGQVSGVVVDAKTRQPLAGVTVEVRDSELPPVATNPRNGRFLTYELPEGPVKLFVSKEGYKPLEHALVLKPGEKPSVELSLEAEVRPAVVTVRVASRKKPVGATLDFRGPETRQVTLAAGVVSQKLPLPAGQYVVDVIAPGFLAQRRGVAVAEGQEVELSFELEPEPRQKLVTLEGDKLELLQQVTFAEGKALILPDSQPLLAQVVDAIVRGGFKRVRVEGHTDNQGDKDANLALSKARAQAVAEALVRAGVEPGRVESEGYGDTRPIAPNLTPRGRELNRRVEIVILER